MENNTYMLLKEQIDAYTEKLKNDRLKMDKIPSTRKCSCNVCTSRNYDTGEIFQKRVDRLFELQIGGMFMYLCDECLERAQQLIKSNIE